jgi:repressor LexA
MAKEQKDPKENMKEFSKLSERQRNILRFMQRYIEKKGFPPTIRDIGLATSIPSTSVVNYNLNKLVEAGYLERDDRVSRGLRLVQDLPGSKKRKKGADTYSRVPLIGHIVASKPVEMPDDAGQHFEEDDMMDLPPVLLGGVDPAMVFALHVKGDSMMDAMIREGDIVIMHSQQTANPGDMVAVWLPQTSETTLKYYYPEGERIRLQPAHPTMDPIYVSASNCEIRGKVLSVIRTM